MKSGWFITEISQSQEASKHQWYKASKTALEMRGRQRKALSGEAKQVEDGQKESEQIPPSSQKALEILPRHL